jgi:peptide-methionine (R)-S-oxide reductase
MQKNSKIFKNSERKWKQKLSKEQYQVLRLKGTETPFSGKLLNNVDKGRYSCVACGNLLFDSETKYNSRCGWPSFWDVRKDAVTFHEDVRFGMKRTEVSCARCGSHLGHVFNDGPVERTGKRYCMNSVALNFSKK